jgi:putative MATE family efflux protein
LLGLAIPLAAGMLFQVAFNLVDAYFIGKLGTDAFAAVNLASFSVWLLSAIVGVVGTGANARVAQALGAGEHRQVGMLRSQALRSSLLLGFLITLVGLAAADTLTLYMSAQKEESRLAAVLASQYLSTILVAAPILCFNDTMAALFRGAGDTKTPTLILSAGFVANACLDPLLIFGYGPLPALGVIGAGLASVLSFVFSLGLFVAFKRDWFGSTHRALSFSLVPKMLRIGLPPSITNIVFCLVYMLVTPFIASQGTEALAALGLGHKVISLSYFLCLAFSLAAITLTGESTGAEDPEEARYRSWVIVVVSSCSNLAVGVFLIVNSFKICSIFSNDPSVVAMAVSYLYIVVPSQLLLGVGMSVEGSFAGFGHTTAPMLISVTTSLVRWPAVAGVIYATDWGVTGIWWVFAISTHIRGLGLLGLLYLGQESNSG